MHPSKSSKILSPQGLEGKMIRELLGTVAAMRHYHYQQHFGVRPIPRSSCFINMYIYIYIYDINTSIVYSQ